MARDTGYREARRSAQCSPTTASPNQRGRVSNPDFSGSYPPDPAEPGRWSGSRDGQRGDGYGGGRRARGTRDAGDRGYRRERDYEWDRGGGADPAYDRGDSPHGDYGRADRGRAGGGRDGGSRDGGSRDGQGWADRSRADQGREDQGWAGPGRAEDQGRAAQGSRRA